MIYGLLWGTTFLLCCFDVYGVHRVALAPGLRCVRWWLVVLWGAILLTVSILIIAVPGRLEETLTEFSWGLALALLFLASAALALHPSSILKPLADLEMKPIGEWITDMVTDLFRLISIDIALSILLIAIHFAGGSIPLLLFTAALIFWALHLRKIRSALSYIGEPLRTFRRLSGTWYWSQTPYDHLISGSRFSWHKPKNKKTFDIFVSYRSLDIAVVRPVVDLLIASGLTVWFAEYTVLLTNREKWRKAVTEGIRQSKYGLLFTNDRFILSEDCRFEVELLLNPQNCGYKHVLDVLEVKIPDEPLTHQRYPKLKDSRAISYDGHQPRRVLEFIQQCETSLLFDIPSNTYGPQPSMSPYKNPHLGYEIDVTGWEQWRDNSVHVKSGQKSSQAVQGSFNVDPDKVNSPVFTRNLGGFRCEWLLTVGPPDPRLRAVPTMIQEVAEKESRELYNKFLHQARLKLEVNILDCRGVHILFCGGFYQRILSYWDRRFWTREYSLLLPHPRFGKYMEFEITFRFWGPFKAYCRYTYLMDQLVMSLGWEEKKLIKGIGELNV